MVELAFRVRFHNPEIRLQRPSAHMDGMLHISALSSADSAIFFNKKLECLHTGTQFYCLEPKECMHGHHRFNCLPLLLLLFLDTHQVLLAVFRLVPVCPFLPVDIQNRLVSQLENVLLLWWYSGLHTVSQLGRKMAAFSLHSL